MNGITNLEIDKFFEKEENEDIKKNYMAVYSIDSITKYNMKKKCKISLCNIQYRQT